jgi:hypothetical protein
MSNQIKSIYEIAVETITAATKDTKIVATEVSTGTSFFEGKKRLCKVLQTKKAIAIEINVVLDKETEKKFNLNRISLATAREKHMGTMKYMANIPDAKALPGFIKVLVASFKAEQAAEKAEFAKAQ